jgi:hypothetical protein
MDVFAKSMRRMFITKNMRWMWSQEIWYGYWYKEYEKYVSPTENKMGVDPKVYEMDVSLAEHETDAVP